MEFGSNGSSESALGACWDEAIHQVLPDSLELPLSTPICWLGGWVSLAAQEEELLASVLQGRA